MLGAGTEDADYIKRLLTMIAENAPCSWLENCLRNRGEEPERAESVVRCLL